MVTGRSRALKHQIAWKRQMSKHILIVSQCFYPEQFRINDIAREWAEDGNKVTVLTGIPNYPQGKFYDGYGWFKKRKENWEGIDIIRIPIIARGKNSIGLVLNYASFVVSGFFWRLFSKINADIVFTFGVSPITQALVGVWCARKCKAQNILYVQDLWPDTIEVVAGIHSKAIIGSVNKMVDYIYHGCDMILATSPSMTEQIRNRLSDDGDKVACWVQYAETFYEPSDEKSDLIARDGALNIVFTGNIGTAQGLEILPQTAQLLKLMGIYVRFNIVGDGRNKDNLLKQIEALEVRDYFNMIEWQPATDIPKILAAADAAFISFSNSPLFSMTIPAKLQSYMACGCPIIAAADGETKRIIEESDCGVTAEVGSAQSLCDAILVFQQTDETRRQIMSQNAIRYCRQHFDKASLMQTMADSYLKLGEQ